MVIEYEKINSILAKHANGELTKYSKLNFYGVITHISQSERSKGNMRLELKVLYKQLLLFLIIF